MKRSMLNHHIKPERIEWLFRPSIELLSNTHWFMILIQFNNLYNSILKRIIYCWHNMILIHCLSLCISRSYSLTDWIEYLNETFSVYIMLYDFEVYSTSLFLVNVCFSHMYAINQLCEYNINNLEKNFFICLLLFSLSADYSVYWSVQSEWSIHMNW